MPDSANTIIAAPLQRRIKNDDAALRWVLIDFDPNKIPLGAAYQHIDALVKQALTEGDRTEQHILPPGDDTHPYIKARLQGKVIRRLVELDQQSPQPPGPVITAVTPDVDEGRYFNPDNMVRSVISVPMLARLEADEGAPHSVLIEMNVNYALGRAKAKERVKELVTKAIEQSGASATKQFISEWKSDTSEQYVYAKLTGKTIRELVKMDQKGSPPPNAEPQTTGGEASQNESDQKGLLPANPEPQTTGDKAPKKEKDWRAIYHVWPDFKIRAQIWRSTATVKADACRRSFATTGRGIVWAIFDSGIDGKHAHFTKHSNLVLPSGLAHMDFTGENPVEVRPENLTDDYGHGTHVAGIIAGELTADCDAVSLLRERDQTGKISYMIPGAAFAPWYGCPVAQGMVRRIADDAAALRSR
jgi:hypothetical protein